MSAPAPAAHRPMIAVFEGFFPAVLAGALAAGAIAFIRPPHGSFDPLPICIGLFFAAAAWFLYLRWRWRTDGRGWPAGEGWFLGVAVGYLAGQVIYMIRHPTYGLFQGDFDGPFDWLSLCIGLFIGFAAWYAYLRRRWRTSGPGWLAADGWFLGTAVGYLAASTVYVARHTDYGFFKGDFEGPFDWMALAVGLLVGFAVWFGYLRLRWGTWADRPVAGLTDEPPPAPSRVSVPAEERLAKMLLVDLVGEIAYFHEQKTVLGGPKSGTAVVLGLIVSLGIAGLVGGGAGNVMMQARRPSNAVSADEFYRQFEQANVQGMIVGIVFGMAVLTVLVWTIVTIRRRQRRRAQQLLPQRIATLAASFPQAVAGWGGPEVLENPLLIRTVLRSLKEG